MTSGKTGETLFIAVFSALFFSFAAFSFFAAYNSPSAGMDAAWDRQARAWKVTSAASWAPFEKGDIIEKIGGMNADRHHLLKHIASLRDRRDVLEWYRARKETFERLESSPAVFLIRRQGVEMPVAVSARQAGFSFLGEGQTIDLFVTGLLFFLIGTVVVCRRGIEEKGLVFFLMCFSMGVAAVSYDMSVLPLLVLPPSILFALNIINALSYLLGFAFLAHLSMLLPGERHLPNRLRLFMPVFYAAVTAIGASLQPMVINAAASGLFALSMFSFGAGYIGAKSTLEKQQMKWVFAGVCFGLLPNIVLSILPLALAGRQLAPISLTAMFFVLIPFSMAFSIQKYRLLDIDSLLEGTFLYMLAFAAIAASDLIFLEVTSRNLGAAAVHPTGGMLFSSALVLLFYAALRDKLRRHLRRFFRKDVLSESKVVASFTDMAAGKPPDAVIGLFTETIRKSLNPRRVALIKRGEDGTGEVFDSFRRRMEPASFWERPLPVPFQDIYVGLPLGKGETPEYAVLMSELRDRFYSNHDMNILRSLLKQARILYENALYYRENIRQYRTILEKERAYRLEKEKIMRDLHDGIGGITTNINLISKMAQNSTEAEMRKALGTISELSGEGLSDIRTFMQGMDGNETWHSLVAEMRNHGRTVMESQGKSFEIRAVVEPGASAPGTLLGLNLLRIFKEALTNIVKHSGGDSAFVCLAVTAEKVLFTISDNGKGLLDGKGPAGRGIGNMKARARDLGGSLEMISGNGTTVRVEAGIPRKYPEKSVDLSR